LPGRRGVPYEDDDEEYGSGGEDDDEYGSGGGYYDEDFDEEEDEHFPLRTKNLFKNMMKDAKEDVENKAEDLEEGVQGVKDAAAKTFKSMDRYDEHVDEYGQKLNGLDKMLERLSDLRTRQFGGYEGDRMSAFDEINPDIQAQIMALKAALEAKERERDALAHASRIATEDDLNPFAGHPEDMANWIRMLEEQVARAKTGGAHVVKQAYHTLKELNNGTGAMDVGSGEEGPGVLAPGGGGLEPFQALDSASGEVGPGVHAPSGGLDGPGMMNGALDDQPGIPMPLGIAGEESSSLLDLTDMSTSNAQRGKGLHTSVDPSNPFGDDVVGDDASDGSFGPDDQGSFRNKPEFQGRTPALDNAFPDDSEEERGPPALDNGTLGTPGATTGGTIEDGATTGGTIEDGATTGGTTENSATTGGTTEDGATTGGTTGDWTHLDPMERPDSNGQGWKHLDKDNLIDKAGGLVAPEDQEKANKMFETLGGGQLRARNPKFFRNLFGEIDVKNLKNAVAASDLLDDTGTKIAKNAAKTTESLVNTHKKMEEWHNVVRTNIKDLDKFEGNIEKLRKTAERDMKHKNSDRLESFDKLVGIGKAANQEIDIHESLDSELPPPPVDDGGGQTNMKEIDGSDDEGTLPAEDEHFDGILSGGDGNAM